MAGWILLVGCSVRCLTVKTSAPLHPRRAHPAELLPRRRQARPSTLGVLPHREGDAVDPLTSSPNFTEPFSPEVVVRGPGAVRVGPRTGDRRSRRPCRGPRSSVYPNLLQRPGSCRSAG